MQIFGSSDKKYVCKVGKMKVIFEDTFQKISFWKQNTCVGHSVLVTLLGQKSSLLNEYIVMLLSPRLGMLATSAELQLSCLNATSLGYEVLAELQLSTCHLAWA